MELMKITERVWFSACEEERDRPCLGYVKGEKMSLVVDAGHSAAHVKEYYAALKKENLPLPDFTVITHWHWDHAFGMHSVHGLTVANRLTNQHLMNFAKKVNKEGLDSFFSLDPSIRKEYAGGQSVVIVPADIVFQEDLEFDLGGVSARLLTSVSPHTDDTTMVLIPEDRILFVGDCISGEFPTWEKDPVKTRKLISTLNALEADICIGGHWPVFRKKELIEALEEDIL